MAAKVDTPLIDGRSNPNYDWGSWFDGDVWFLKAGEDYQIDLGSFRSVASQAGARRGKKVSVRVADGGVLIQARG